MLNPLRKLHLKTARIAEKSGSGAQQGKSTAVAVIIELDARLTEFAQKPTHISPIPVLMKNGSRLPWLNRSMLVNTGQSSMIDCFFGKNIDVHS